MRLLNDDEDVLGHMRVADTFVSPSTREGFGLTFAEAVAAECPVTAAAHPNSAADEVIGEAGCLAKPTVLGVETVLERALDGERRVTRSSARRLLTGIASPRRHLLPIRPQRLERGRGLTQVRNQREPAEQPGAGLLLLKATKPRHQQPTGSHTRERPFRQGSIATEIRLIPSV